MPKKGKSDKGKKKECYTRSGGKGTYVVCNDPPKGSKGQQGVYQRKRPKGTKTKKEIAKEEAAERRERKEEYRDKTAWRRHDGDPSKEIAARYELTQKREEGRMGGRRRGFRGTKNQGGEGMYDNSKRGTRPKVDTMRKQLVKAGARESGLVGMGLTYVMDRWLKETPEGKKYKKIHDTGKPRSEFWRRGAPLPPL
tara:strand:- start:871 stop:1458 length:588 start_codon:yes stop_codon:yes gene_type:complete